MSKQNLAAKSKLNICMFGQKRIPSREGGVEVVVEELATRMAQQGHSVTCYNRGGHHVSGSAFDAETRNEYKDVRLKTVPTIDKKPANKKSSPQEDLTEENLQGEGE